MSKPITLEDVAAEAGVSAATVSRALARRRGGSEPRTTGARRALEAADRLGYRLNTVASALRTRSTRLIGVIVPDLTDTAVSQMYAGVEARAAQLGYQTCVANSRDDQGVRAQRVEAFRAHGVDGIIFADARLGEDYFASLAADDFPYLLMSRPLPGEVSVTGGDEAAGHLAGTHLTGQGHRRVAVLAGPEHAGNVVLRTRGFERAILEGGGHCDIVHSGFGLDGAREALSHYLESAAVLPTAIFATIDRFALAAVRVLAQRSMEVGVDVAVVACNDSNLAANLPVPLTAVRQPLGGMGARAAELLLGMIAAGPGGADIESVAFEPALVVRESSAFSPARPR